MKRVLCATIPLLLVSLAASLYAADSFFSKRVPAGSKTIQTPPIKHEAIKLQPPTGAAKLPDLLPNSISFSPGKPQTGQTVTVWVKVWNPGDVDSSAATVKLVMRATHPPQDSNPPAFTASAPLESVTPNMAKVAAFSIPLTNATQGQWKAEATVTGAMT